MELFTRIWDRGDFANSAARSRDTAGDRSTAPYRLLKTVRHARPPGNATPSMMGGGVPVGENRASRNRLVAKLRGRTSMDMLERIQSGVMESRISRRTV